MDVLPSEIRLPVSIALYVCAYASGLLVFLAAARRRGLDTLGVRLTAVAGLLGGIAGATVAQALIGGAPGRTIIGGIAGGYLAVVLFKRHLGLRRPLGDLFALALSAGEAVGRLGCFVYGCCEGRATTVAWAVRDDGVLRHPTDLYCAASAGLTYALLRRLDASAQLPENALFFLQGSLFCATRFLIEFLRDGAPSLGIFTLAQWATLVGLVFFGTRLIGLMRATTAQAPRPVLA